jgi:Fur family transcriptional regulator, ferric uptake regulator
MSCEEHFVEQLHAHGLRVTPQREIVLSVLHDLHGFSTAEEIRARVQAVAASIDLSTVYRTLDLLAALQLVSVLEGGDGQRRYELLGLHGLHHHLRCTACDAVTGVPHAALEPLLVRLEEAYGFAVAPTSWTFAGLCAVCQEVSTQP